MTPSLLPTIQRIVTQQGYCDQVWINFFQELASKYGQYNTINIDSSDSPYTITRANLEYLGLNLVCDTTGGAIVVNYPAGVANDNIRASNAGASGNNVTLNANGSEKIRGLSSQTLLDGDVLNTIFGTVKYWI